MANEWRIRKQVLAQWRRYWEPKPEKQARPVGEVMTRYVKDLGLTERVDHEAVKKAWRSIVGDFLADHSEPVRLKRGVLIVQVLQPSVHYELDRNCKPTILKRLQEQFGAKLIRDVDFSLG